MLFRGLHCREVHVLKHYDNQSETGRNLLLRNQCSNRVNIIYKLSSRFEISTGLFSSSLQNLLIMDNAAAHCCRSTKETLQRLGINAYFLLPNSPFTDPVEYTLSTADSLIKNQLEKPNEDYIQEHIIQRNFSTITEAKIDLLDLCVHEVFDKLTKEYINRCYYHIRIYIRKSRLMDIIEQEKFPTL